MAGPGLQKPRRRQSERAGAFAGRAGLREDRPLCVFRCADSFFDDAALCTGEGARPAEKGTLQRRLGECAEEAERPACEENAALASGGISSSSSAGGLSCHTCAVEALVFQSLQEQRLHFKSDWHRFNVKRRLAQKIPVTEEAFDAMVADRSLEEGGVSDASSISGSEDDEEGGKFGRATPKLRLLLKTTGLHVTVWQVLATGELHESSQDAILGSLQSLAKGRAPWMVLLCAGGHFAGVVVDSKGGSVLAHQTFHRYVVRAKAGGRQSTRDATGRAPKSAGAALRRYNEMALEKEIKELLSSWKHFLESAALIFVYAPSTNSQTLFGGDSALLQRNDPRVRRIPISVRRPTFKESLRVLTTLSSIDYEAGREEAEVLVPESPLKAQHLADVRHGAQLEDLKLGESKSRKLGVPLEDAEMLRSRSSLGAAPINLDEEHVNETIRLGHSTQLHVASLAGDAARVSELLNSGEDPTVRDERGRTPYSVASDKETRNAFRRYMAEVGERWDWQTAGVPSALTADMEAAQAGKKAEKDAKRRAREKEKRAERRAQEKNATVNDDRLHATTDGLSKTGPSSMQDEREKRAIAAEARLKLMSLMSPQNVAKGAPQPGCSQPVAAAKDGAEGPAKSALPSPSESGEQLSCRAGVCASCGISLKGMTPFHRLDYAYCSTTCVHVHRLVLERCNK